MPEWHQAETDARRGALAAVEEQGRHNMNDSGIRDTGSSGCREQAMAAAGCPPIKEGGAGALGTKAPHAAGLRYLRLEYSVSERMQVLETVGSPVSIEDRATP